MGIQLTKGGRFNLSKEAPDLKKVAIALGWQVSQSGQSYDIDASVYNLLMEHASTHSRIVHFFCG